MALEGCYGCIKYLMFAFNFLFWVLGCVILGIGIWIKVDPSSLKKLTQDDATLNEFFNEIQHYGYEQAGAYILITVGSIIMVIGFLGCCGAIRESQCMLVLFFIFLSIIFLALLVCGVYLIIVKNKLKDDIVKQLGEKINKVKAGDQEAMKFMKLLQDKLDCCGNDHGLSDYTPYIDRAQCSVQNTLRPKPCSDEIYNNLSQNFIIIGGVAIGIALVMFLGMVFSMLLCCAIRENMA